MPVIKPYPQQPQPQSMYYAHHSHPQQQNLNNLPVYRPAYHRIPSTTISFPHHQKDAWISTTFEVSPIVVPSMSPTTLHPQFLNFYTGVYRQQVILNNDIPQQQPQQPLIEVNQVSPIHHTLENAIITYDSTQHNLQKELVKDVFFSPAMITDSDTREMSPSDSFSSSFSASTGDNDSIFSATTPPSSHYEQSPSEFLLEQDTLFDFGLDLATTCATSNLTTTSSYKEIKVAAAAAVDYFTDISSQQQQNRRRCSDSVLQERKKKKQRQTLLDQLGSTSSGSYDNVRVQTDEAHISVESGQFNDANSTSTTETYFQQLPEFNDDNLTDTAREEKPELLKKIEAMSTASVTKPGKIAKKSTKSSDKGALLIGGSFLPTAPPCSTVYLTKHQNLSGENVEWCRYCGTNEGVILLPGPWGNHALCSKHGYDYKNCSFACKIPHLDLTAVANESIDERERPIFQEYCSTCKSKDSCEGNMLLRCEGCPRAYHQKCRIDTLLDNTIVDSKDPSICASSCYETAGSKKNCSLPTK
ncbi:hypothetical protein [Parasitella parasitica]|uniref:PHD-type domain-containing protein n=1 Tax=Parasitella parasitica TaxID=35722 RepID=A0A0B7NJT3_9FUNG|nr:hypothetical protein [Parasitella parasitica]